MSDPVPAEEGSAPADPRKDALRLARRVRRLEATLEHVELIRDTNARVLDRLLVELDTERARSRSLLLNVLPQPIVDRLAAGEAVIADRHDDVSVVFSDFVGFTVISSRLPPATLVAQLNDLFSAFDDACETFAVEKIKTIGDAYLAVAGLDGAADHVTAAADLALAMTDAVATVGQPWQVRIGMHRGPVVAGVIGRRKFAYDVWGDTVNVASRLEGASEPARIHVSEAVASALGGKFELEARGSVELKGVGPATTWFLNRRLR